MWSVKAVDMWSVRKVKWSVRICEWSVALFISVPVYFHYYPQYSSFLTDAGKRHARKTANCSFSLALPKTTPR